MLGGFNLRELDIDYPVKYEDMAELGEYLRGNTSLVTLRLQKIKPMHLHFLSALSENTTLKTLTLEIFKITNQELYWQAEHDTEYFDGLPRNQVL